MSVKVELARLLEVSAGFGTGPMLLTADADGRPRAAAVAVSWDADVATVRAGHRSVANAAERPLVSLLWPAPPGGRFALLVDGEVTEVRPDAVPEAVPDAAPGDAATAGHAARGRSAKVGGFVVVQATGGILHVVDRAHA